MNAPEKVIVTVNGGSSSIKFAAFAAGSPLRRMVGGSIDRIGLPGAALTISRGGKGAEKKEIEAASQAAAAGAVAAILREEVGEESVAGVGHRIVHGGLRAAEHQRITPALLAVLREACVLDPVHLPGEISLVEAFQEEFPEVAHVACFDTAFHRDMPTAAKMLPIPRRYFAAGVRRYGFHGLSYAYLMQELARVAGADAARGKIILAHLGSGASMAAVREGKPIDTTMGFTPLAGLVMGTRPGDLDPGLLTYLLRTERLTADELDEFLSRRCGLAGISGMSSDMRDLLDRRGDDSAAAEAVDLFCYRARQWIGSLAATMEGLDTLVFSAGIGEHAPEVRGRICEGLAFLGVRLDAARNAENAAIISAEGSAVTVHVLATDEEIMIARITERLALPSAPAAAAASDQKSGKPEVSPDR